MKVLFVSPGVLYSSKHPFEQRGSESQILGISRELSRLGHEVHVTGRFETMANADIRFVDGVHFINIKTPNLRDDRFDEIGSAILYSMLVARKAKTMTPDVICLNERFSAYFPSRLDFPKIFTTHNPDAMTFYREFACEFNKLNYVFFNVKQRIEESVMNRSDTIIALTRSAKGYLAEKGFTRTTVIPNAVNPEDYKCHGDSNYILYAGRLSKVKGLAYLVRAYSSICSRHDTKLIIAGSGEDELTLKSIVEKEGLKDRVFFVPFLGKTELREFLSECSMFVLPSLFESMPVTLLEAMASEKAVIASDIPGPKDVIRDGQNGILFERGNIKELEKCMETLLNDEPKRKSLGKNARRTIEENHSFKRISQQYIGAFNSIDGGLR